MKKSLIFFITLVFCVGSLYAAPAQNSQQGGGTSTKRVNTTKKTTSQQTKTKSQERKEAQNQEFGLMPSELDDMNREVFHADAAAIKGARDTESAMRYLPFVTIVNTAGFGNQFDLRGQGRLSSNGLKFQINGINVTPVDSYYGFMPINTVLPSLIQEIQVMPGVEARGGTINVITSQRSAPVYIVGAGYVNTVATEGNSFNVFAQAAENIEQRLKVNAGLAYTQQGGPRESDTLQSGQAVLGGWYDIGWGQSVTLDVDFFYGKNKTSPYNSFVNGAEANAIMFDNRLANWTPQETWSAIPLLERMIGATLDPDKSIRANKGYGEIKTTQIRAVGVLGWQNQVAQQLNFDAKVFAVFNNRKFDKYELLVPYFNLMGISPMFPYPLQDGVNVGALGEKGQWNLIDQSGSTFNEMKFGGSVVMDYKHDKGLFRFGYDAMYVMNKRTPTQYLRSAISHGKNDPFQSAAEQNIDNVNSYNQQVWINNSLDIKQFSSALFVRENYNFNRNFSIMGGIRYEIMNYNIKAKDEIYGGAYNVNLNPSNNHFNVKAPWVEMDVSGKLSTPEEGTFEKDFKKNYDNFLFELAPVYRYSNTGLIFARAETGWLAPPAYGVIQRAIAFQTEPDKKLIVTPLAASGYKEVKIKDESYYTAEVGWKEMIGTRKVPLGFTNLTLNALLFSVTGFYTASQNEFYFNGDPYSGMQFGTWDKSRRMGIELAAEQYLFGGALSFNESFTYLKAQKFAPVGTWTKPGATVQEKMLTEYVCADCEEKWDTIPYTYDYKATLGAAVDVTGWVEVVDVSVSIWIQNSLYGNQRVPSRNQTATQRQFIQNQSYVASNVTDEEAKLKPYVISDFGVSMGINKNMGVITLGVKNLFDTYYYDYYNHDRTASINENRYVVGRGRTVFLEGTFRY